MADSLRYLFLRSMKLGRAFCGGISLLPAHALAVVSCAKLASPSDCSPSPCTFHCLSLCLFFISCLPPTLALWQSPLAERFSSPKPEENCPCFCCLPCQPGELSWLMDSGAKTKQWDNVAESEEGGRFAKGEQDLGSTEKFCILLHAFGSISIRCSNHNRIMSPLDFTNLMLQFIDQEKVSVSTRSC